MSWTTPRTWVTDELVTAALMNTHVRDNLDAVPHLMVRKTSDQSVTSSTTEVSDTALQLTLAANEIWHVKFGVRFTGNTTGNFKMGFTFPTGAAIDLTAVGYRTSGTLDMARWTVSTSPAASIDFINNGVGTLTTYLPVEGVVVNGGTGGTLIMQWAQNTSNGTATTVKANSTLFAVKLA